MHASDLVPTATPAPVRSIMLLLVLITLLAACAGGTGPAPTFDPATPCTVDGQQPGAYPELEALLPGAWESREPTSIDSGRTCTTEALGALAAYGIEELRFAGATWQVVGPSGFTLAVFEADGLDPDLLVEFYEAGARSARPDDDFRSTDISVGDLPATRLDVEGKDGSSQTVVAWPDPSAAAEGPGRVFALLVAGMDDSQVTDLLQVFGEG